MDPLAEYAGVFFLALLVMATTILWFRDRNRTRDDPAGRRRANRRALTFLVCASPPWVAMTLGNIIGGIHNPIDFLNPQSGLFALLFMATLIWVWAAMLYWLLAKGGAKELAESGHMSLVGRQVSDPRTIKLIFILSVVGGFCALVWYVVQRS